MYHVNFPNMPGQPFMQMPTSDMNVMKRQQFPMVTDIDPAAPFRGGMQNDAMTVQIDELVNQGALTQDPGYLSMMNQFQAPQMNTAKFDPRGALMGGALMDLSEIILGNNPSNNPMKAYQMGRQMYMQDRSLENQQKQRAFQNQIAVGGLMATLAKDSSPNDIRLMKAYGLDPMNPDDVKKFYAMSNQGKGTNVTLGQPGEGDEYNKAINTALGKADAEYILGQGKVLGGDELSKIAVLESLNDEIGTSGFVGNVLDVGQNAFASIFPDSDYQLSSETPLRDLYRQVSNTFVLDEAARQTGALSDGDIILFQSVIPNLDQSAAGRKFATSFMKATAQRRKDVAEAFLAWSDARMADKKQPSQTAWLRSDEFKALKNQSMFDSNPELLAQIYAASTTTKNKKKIMDMRIDQLEKQGITDEAQISDIMRREGF